MNKRVGLIIIGVVIIFLGIFLWSRHNFNKSETKDNKLTAQQLPSINGILVDSTIAGKRPIAVVIENHPDSRPQSGLEDADIIYEAPTEAGITRFLALFQTKEPPNIGPIRSARIYFNQIANQWGGVYAHVGGNSDALAAIRTEAYPNLSNADQFFNADYFHRTSERPAPHNVYTSLEKLRELIVHSHYSETANYQPWPYKDTATIGLPPAEDIKLNFSTPSYLVRYLYNKNTNTYLRYLAGKPVLDAETGEQLTARNIIVQFAESSLTQTDTVGSIAFNLNTEGKADFFLDGEIIEGTWKNVLGTIHYYDSSGKVLNLNRGVTWVELVPSALSQNLRWSANNAK